MRRTSRAQDIADQARGRVAPVIDEARKRVAPVIGEAEERISPYLKEARSQANETLLPAARSAAEDARRTYEKKVAPQVGAAIASAAAASEPYREEAMRRGSAALAAAKGEVDAPKQKSSHKLRNLLVLLGLGGLVFAAVRYFKDDSAAWESDYPATGPTAVPDPSDPVSAAEGPGPVTDDAGAASPDVALADRDEHPHRPTDPDNPLERKDL